MRYRINHIGGYEIGPCITEMCVSYGETDPQTVELHAMRRVGGYNEVVADAAGPYLLETALKIANRWNREWSPDKVPAPIRTEPFRKISV